MRSSEQDIKVRKALAWDACHKLNRVWSSPLKSNIKVRLFLATVESVLLYGSNTWTLTKKFEQQLDGTYTRMLRKALNVSWRQHTTNEELYKNLQNVSKKIAERRLRLAGHCLRPWLLEGPEYMRPKLIFQSDICIILVQFLGIQSQFLAISFLGPQTTIIRIK